MRLSLLNHWFVSWEIGGALAVIWLVMVSQEAEPLSAAPGLLDSPANSWLPLGRHARAVGREGFSGIVLQLLCPGNMI